MHLFSLKAIFYRPAETHTRKCTRIFPMIKMDELLNTFLNNLPRNVILTFVNHFKLSILFEGKKKKIEH